MLRYLKRQFKIPKDKLELLRKRYPNFSSVLLWEWRFKNRPDNFRRGQWYNNNLLGYEVLATKYLASPNVGQFSQT